MVTSCKEVTITTQNYHGYDWVVAEVCEHWPHSHNALIPVLFYKLYFLGCPFRHWDKEHLQRMLTTHGISHSDSNKIMDYVENSHYQLACQKYFDITHGVRCYFVFKIC